jgi:hypothetical protein
MKSFNIEIKFRRKVEPKLARMADSSFLCLPLYKKIQNGFLCQLMILKILKTLKHFCVAHDGETKASSVFSAFIHNKNEISLELEISKYCIMRNDK